MIYLPKPQTLHSIALKHTSICSRTLPARIVPEARMQQVEHHITEQNTAIIKAETKIAVLQSEKEILQQQLNEKVAELKQDKHQLTVERLDRQRLQDLSEVYLEQREEGRRRIDYLGDELNTAIGEVWTLQDQLNERRSMLDCVLLSFDILFFGYRENVIRRFDICRFTKSISILSGVSKCVLCRFNVSDGVAMPCKHQTICTDCFDDLQDAALRADGPRGKAKCPVCRRKMNGWHRISF